MTKPCPFCAEPIDEAARKCKHCGEYLDTELRAATVAADQKAARKVSARRLNKISWVFVGFAFLAYVWGAKGLAQVLMLVAVVYSIGVHVKGIA